MRTLPSGEHYLGCTCLKQEEKKGNEYISMISKSELGISCPYIASDPMPAVEHHFLLVFHTYRTEVVFFSSPFLV